MSLSKMVDEKTYESLFRQYTKASTNYKNSQPGSVDAAFYSGVVMGLKGALQTFKIAEEFKMEVNSND
jgi:hypothetical protein